MKKHPHFVDAAAIATLGAAPVDLRRLYLGLDKALREAAEVSSESR